MTEMGSRIAPLYPDSEPRPPPLIPSSVRLLVLHHHPLDFNLSGASHVLKSLRQNMVHQEHRRLAMWDRLYVILLFTLMRALLCGLLVEPQWGMLAHSCHPLLVTVQ